MKRFAVPLLLAETGFFIALGCMISTRLDAAAVTLLSGVLIGTLIGAPIAGLATYTVLRLQSDSLAIAAVSPNRPLAATPVMNRPQPAFLPQQPDTLILPTLRRRFYVIGEDGVASELMPDGTHKAVTYIDEPPRL